VRFHPSNKVVRQNAVAANTTVRISEDRAGTIVPPPQSTPDAGAADGAGAEGAPMTTTGAAGAAGTGGATGTGGGASGAAGTSGATGASGAAGAAGRAPQESGGGGCSCALSSRGPDGPDLAGLAFSFLDRCASSREDIERGDASAEGSPMPVTAEMR
jgi:hypothetical protein